MNPLSALYGAIARTRNQLYDRGSFVTCREVTSSVCAVTRVQLLPEQKNRPNAQASTRSVFAPFIVMQVCSVGTIGGNIANGSPIGDTPPALIAVGATLVLQRGAATRELALEDFFVAYGRQHRHAPPLTPQSNCRGGKGRGQAGWALARLGFTVRGIELSQFHAI